MRYSEWKENESSQQSGYQVHRVTMSEPWQYPEHGHRGFCEMVYVMEGTLNHVVNGRELTQQAGDLILLRTDDRHKLAGCGFSYANIMFQDNWLVRLEQYTQLRGQAQQLLLAEEAPRARIPAERETAFREMIDELISNSRLESGRMVFSGFLAVAATRYLAPVMRQTMPEALPDWLHKSILWLNRQRKALPSLADLVRFSCRSQEHLTRAFTRHLGISPSRYLARMRIEQAAIHLASTNYSVQEIAGLCGFVNESYFYRLFRKNKNTTPLAYRRKHGPRSIQRNHR
jgi:AraC family transcriptional regulator, dual regulator of chb operon